MVKMIQPILNRLLILVLFCNLTEASVLFNNLPGEMFDELAKISNGRMKRSAKSSDNATSNSTIHVNSNSTLFNTSGITVSTKTTTKTHHDAHNGSSPSGTGHPTRSGISQRTTKPTSSNRTSTHTTASPTPATSPASPHVSNGSTGNMHGHESLEGDIPNHEPMGHLPPGLNSSHIEKVPDHESLEGGTPDHGPMGHLPAVFNSSHTALVPGPESLGGDTQSHGPMGHLPDTGDTPNHGPMDHLPAGLNSSHTIISTDTENESNEGSSSLMESLMCAPSCLANLSLPDNENGTNFPDHKDTYQFAVSIVQASGDPQGLYSFCRSYQQARNCIKSCPKSPLEDLIIKGLTVPDFICITHFDEYSQHASCIANASDSAESICNKTCSTQMTAVKDYSTAMMGNFSGMISANENVLGNFLKEMCELLTCYNNCSTPILEGQCGQEAANLVNGFDSVAIGWIFDMIHNVDTGGNNLPQRCGGHTRMNSTSHGNTSDHE